MVTLLKSTSKKSEHELEELLAPRKKLGGLFGKKNRTRSEDAAIRNKVGGGIFRSASKEKAPVKIHYEPPTPPLSPESSESSPPFPVGNIVGVKHKTSMDDGDDALDERTMYSDITDNRTYSASPMAPRETTSSTPVDVLGVPNVPATEGDETLVLPDPPGDVNSMANNSDPVASMKDTLRNRQPPAPACCGEDTTVETGNFVTKIFGVVSCTTPASVSCTAPASVDPAQDDDSPDAESKNKHQDIRKVLSYTPVWGVAPSEDEADGAMRQRSTADASKKGTVAAYASASAAGSRKSEPPASTGTFRSQKSQASSDGFEMVLEDHSPEKSEPVKKKKGWKRLFKKDKKDQGQESPEKSDSATATTAKKVPEATPVEQRPVRVEPAMEEEKKEDDSYNNEIAAEAIAVLKKKRRSPSKGKASKEARYKNVLSSFKSSPIRSSNLETVPEDCENSVPSRNNNESTELKVRVPGIEQPDIFLSDEDLVGAEYVDEDDTVEGDESVDEEESAGERESTASTEISAEEKADVAAATVVVKKAKEVNEMMQNLWLQEIKKIPKVPANAASKMKTESRSLEVSDAPNSIKKSHSLPVAELASVPIQRSRSWYDRLGLKSLGLKRTTSAAEDDCSKSTTSFSRNRSAPVALKSSNTKKSKKDRPVWKAALDESCGRVYYYHRLTRQTTWTKPPDFGMLQSELEESEAKKSQKEKDAELRKQSSRDFDPAVWSTKEQIVALLQTMAPPDGSSVDNLMKQYEGNEEELLANLRDLAESRPFDEPMVNASNNNQDTDEDESSSPGPMSIDGKRTRTATSYLSGFSGATRVSEKTELICNTASPTNAKLLSSTGSFGSNSEVPGQYVNSPPRLVPVPRTRELHVEEFTSDRVNAETYGGSAVIRSPRRHPPKEEEPSFLQVWDLSPYLGDIEDTDVDTNTETETESLPNTTVSALSDSDQVVKNVRQAGFEAKRRRALEEAIATENWDLAAELSEGMRSGKSKRVKPTKVPAEWTQSELDKFISENDWDAVANYIAYVRDSTKQTSRRNESSTRAPRKMLGSESQTRMYHSETDESNPKKRFGARSQLQHSDINSDSSWDSSGASSYYSEDSSEESYYSDEDPLFLAANNKRRTKKEFAC